ncbi:MAG: restriction endonuclease subunit S [Dehalococcoidia bacterium]|nr:MAG: restriction endonuclease subunit S [Dehalococcoidia bacterium]
MSVGLTPYPTQTDSALPWLESIPADWHEKRAKYFFREVDERTTSGEEELLSVSHVTGVTPRSQKNVTMFMAESYSDHKLCRPGDLVINTMWAWMAALGVARHTGIVSPAYAVYRPKDPDAFLPEFLDHLLRTKPYAAEYRCRSTGIRSSRLRLYPEKFLGIPIVCPPRSEQVQILAYLNAKDRQFRRLIRAKRRLIELLNEQKQAIIHHAATRGLDPNVRLKPSGIAWLGDVPEGWEVRRAKYSYREVDERSETGSEELLSVSHLTGVTPRSEKNITMFMASSYAGHKMCEPGDLVINTMWAWMGALGVARSAGIVSPAYAVYRPLAGSAMLPEFADHLLRIKPYISEYICRSTGIRSSRLRLYPDKFLGIPLVLPPRDEQQQIVAAITAGTRDANEAIGHANRAVDLLREYRTRLIADVVTGKLDVRGVELPPLDDDSTLDEIDAPDDGDAQEPLEAGEDGDGPD